MSSDDGYCVCKVFGEDKLYGVFRYCASSDESATWYGASNACSVHINPVEAILEAHSLEKDSFTEYGVSVSCIVLEEAVQSFSDDRHDVAMYRSL